MFQRVSSFYNMTTNETRTLVSGAAILERVVINTTAAGTIVVYNNTAGSGATVASMPASQPVGGYEYGCFCPVGITVVTGHADLDITVVWTPWPSLNP